jgi:hypothetical protein
MTLGFPKGASGQSRFQLPELGAFAGPPFSKGGNLATLTLAKEYQAVFFCHQTNSAGDNQPKVAPGRWEPSRVRWPVRTAIFCTDFGNDDGEKRTAGLAGW